ncbi:hypothetical protein JZO73_00785 [Enterococcus plantarum]|uniref:Uncharacterized protein n=1 Tax=Enterococcus plantarum TaxID=1077675 RepID=A0A2W3ZBS6_9ENTE|nr:hypothetical protein [Enterococcus plantarum]MBO0466065.1 hypothetical protein [Enterococcus plantarum]PZL77208.1 hypothetical protein CI088_01820 [Enterococcus plantarum]
MKNKSVALLKIDTDKSVYFDLSKRKLFIQEFIGPYTEKSGKSYSKSQTWGISAFIGMFLIPLIAKQFNLISLVPNYINILCISGVGFLMGKLLTVYLIDRSKGQYIEKKFTKKDVQKILNNSSNLRILAVTELLFIFGYSIFLIILPFIEKTSVKGIIGIFALCFAVSGIHFSAHPFAQQKAFRILKKQMKAGMYDE